MTWAQLIKRLFYVLRVRFAKQHICSVCGEAKVAMRNLDGMGTNVFYCAACEEEQQAKREEAEATRKFNDEAHPEFNYVSDEDKINNIIKIDVGNYINLDALNERKKSRERQYKIAMGDKYETRLVDGMTVKEALTDSPENDKIENCRFENMPQSGIVMPMFDDNIDLAAVLKEIEKNGEKTVKVIAKVDMQMIGKRGYLEEVISDAKRARTEAIKNARKCLESMNEDRQALKNELPPLLPEDEQKRLLRYQKIAGIKEIIK